ncbi:D,D-peptidase/D,D-carboxypeptidase VanY-N [Nonomuraea sp. NPDC050783]|uniref:D,D-peptidase/D,D-carboxypeptidase VanY-N n=1 Tax=Nonomuraea sp. NPDC050783 TaxID=3154634 RepID=UPI0034653297
MNEPRTIPPRLRDRLYAALTLVLAALLLPAAFARRPGHARELACHWALALRFPAEDLTGLTDGTRAAFSAARTEALWRHRQLIGLTSGYRDPAVQQRMFEEEARRRGSATAARMLVLPAAESPHVRGIALDVRPHEGARWLEEHGARYDLYRIYDNEWWHFEHHPQRRGTPPRRLAHPGERRTGWTPATPATYDLEPAAEKTPRPRLGPPRRERTTCPNERSTAAPSSPGDRQRPRAAS